MPVVTSYANGTPSWMDLMTSDREAATRFYGALFGWTFEVGQPETGYYTMCLKNGEPVAGIGQQQQDSDFPVAWTTYLAVDDADKTCTSITEHGGQVMMAPMDVMEEGRMAIAADPTGAVFGLWQAGRHHGARLVNEPGGMCWNEVNTRDTATASRFYADVFGLGLEKMPEPSFDYVMLQVAGRTVGGVFNAGDQMPAEVPPHWRGYFAVDDADAAAIAVTQTGGTVVKDPFDTPYGRIAVISDPHGGTVSIMKLADSPPQ